MALLIADLRGGFRFNLRNGRLSCRRRFAALRFHQLVSFGARGLQLLLVAGQPLFVTVQQLLRFGHAPRPQPFAFIQHLVDGFEQRAVKNEDQ